MGTVRVRDRVRATRFGKAVLAVAREKQITIAAAGLAYYAFNALIPLCVLLVVGLAVFGRVDAALDLLGRATGLDFGPVRPLLSDLLGNTAGRRRAAVLATLILLWSSMRMFQAVSDAFGALYETRKRQSSVRRWVDAGLMLGTVALAFGLLGVVGVSLSFVVDGVAWGVASLLLLCVALVGVFLPMYYRFPGVRIPFREALPGAVFAALAWTASGLGFRLYAATSESVRLYGVLGGVLLLLTWMYVGGLVLLVGAIVNAVLARRVDVDYEWLPAGDH